jgi:spore coat-associated protein N
MNKMNKSLVTAFLLTMIGALLIGGATVAWFTSEDSNTDNAFVAGTFEISLDKDNLVEKYFNITNTFPGDEGSATMVVTNKGSLPMDYFFTLTTSGALFEGSHPVQVKINDIAGNPISDLAAERRLEPGQSEEFTIFYMMPIEADNSYQGAAGSLDISVSGNQINR